LQECSEVVNVIIKSAYETDHDHAGLYSAIASTTLHTT